MTEEPNYNDLYLQSVDDEFGLMDGPLPALMDSAQAVFSVTWGHMGFPGLPFRVETGQAFAAARETTGSFPLHNGGVDMGDVVLETPHGDVELNPFHAFRGRFVYSSFGMPADSGQHGRGRSPVHGFNFFNFNTITFEANAVYSFNVNGSDQFPAMTIQLETPSAKAEILSVNNGATPDSTHDLSIRWQGGDADYDVLIVIIPFANPHGRPGNRNFKPGDKPDTEMIRPDIFGKPVVARFLEENNGSYTFPREEWTRALEKFDTKSLMVNVSLVKAQRDEISGKTVVGIIRLQDRQLVSLQ